jgi:hypothetical protein
MKIKFESEEIRELLADLREGEDIEVILNFKRDLETQNGIRVYFLSYDPGKRSLEIEFSGKEIEKRRIEVILRTKVREAILNRI